ncbi:DUF4198 domain-containing protein [Actomonas aquatica]|uniref:DUF4198 domain-containing protein n=1 Tax=Actomonas aquatica TaxID=2866162 RepID=A0ABZ1CD83_9BACT|nr:DUF4198 domain-containing protein [Opitutus sp. WL0086]WRQ89620.1 DUF4198 domain-containing protein [Opitutus sp. WL0086]
MMLAACGSGCVFGEPVSVQVKVIDDLGTPLAGGDVLVLFQGEKAKPQGERILQSDANGVVRIQGETTYGVTLRAWKSGHYETESEFSIDPRKPVERTYVLPRILNPIPLFAAREEYQ